MTSSSLSTLRLLFLSAREARACARIFSSARDERSCSEPSSVAQLGVQRVDCLADAHLGSRTGGGGVDAHDAAVARVAAALEQAVGLELVEVPDERRRLDVEAGRELGLAEVGFHDRVVQHEPGREASAVLRQPLVDQLVDGLVGQGEHPPDAQLLVPFRARFHEHELLAHK